MMSKKMKRLAFESSSYGVYEEPKARLKHQVLFQDYQELHKETDDLRNKLEDTKLRKLRLLAEVRFLRQRRKHLLQLRSLSQPQGAALVPLPNTETYPKNRSKSHVISKKEAKLNKIPRLPVPKQKGRIQVASKKTPDIHLYHEHKLSETYPNTETYPKNRSKSHIISKKEAKLNKLPRLPVPKQNGRIQVASKKTPDIHLYHEHKLGGGKDSLLHYSVYLNSKARVYSGKEIAPRNGLKGAPGFDLKQNERLFMANNAVLQRTPAFDLNDDTGHCGKEAALPTRAPAFDLNEISMGEEEPQANFERVKFEEPKRSLIRNLSDDQHNDLKLLVCRNIGEGTSRVEKRKISWQDPVALRV